MSVMQNTHGYKISKNSPKLWIKEFPWRKKSGHKYSLGRVVIYGSWATSVVPCHRDDPPSENYDQMITFNPGGYRPVYIYDSMRQKKRHLPEDWKAYSYNTTDYHGVDSVPHFSYTVRVDGQFK